MPALDSTGARLDGGVRALGADAGVRRVHHLHGRGLQRVRRRVPPGERRPQLPQRRQDPGVERGAGHAAPAHARPPDDARARQAAVGVRHRMRRGRHGGRGVDRSARGAGHHRRDRAARGQDRLHLLQRLQLRRRPQPEGAGEAGRRAARAADVEGDVRRHHVGPPGPVGEGRRDALHEGVLRAGEVAAEPRRRGDDLRAAVREQRGGGEERDRDVLRRLPARQSSSRTRSTAPATTWSCSARRSRCT